MSLKTISVVIDTELTDEQIENGEVILSVGEHAKHTRHVTAPPKLHRVSKVVVIKELPIDDEM